MSIDVLIRLVVSSAVALSALVYLIRLHRKMRLDEKVDNSFASNIAIIVLSVAGWFFLESLIATLFIPSVFHTRPDPHTLFGVEVDNSVMTGTIATLMMLILAVIFRLAIFPKFKASPGVFQGFMESLVGFVYRHTDAGKVEGMTPEQLDEFKDKQKERVAQRVKFVIILVIFIMLWFLQKHLFTWIYGASKSKLVVEVFPERVSILGFSISSSVATAWVVVAIVFVASLLFRLLAVPKFKELPTGIQNAVEIAVEKVQGYVKGQSHVESDELSSYIFSLAIYLIGCAACEFIGARSPSADLAMTFSIALMTFVMINYYGIRRKGVAGRLKSFANPSPIVFPMKVISDFALPISLACRLFGNMVGGMIVVELLYVALGNGAVGIPAVFGLYFNVFHPLIQAYIFITLTLTFIDEAVE